MRILNLDGRLSLAVRDGAVDVETASGGTFPADVMSVYERWDEFAQWARDFSGAPDRSLDDAAVGPPVPRPAQVFAVGLNYRDHATEAGLGLPDRPMVFTKFPAAVTGPYGEIVLPSDTVDFEVELVAVVGRRARNVVESDAWAHIAGLTAGQDLSDRAEQLSGPPPQQYNLGKSFEGFAPIGPALVTPDEFADPDDIALGCQLSGVQMQKGRTRDFVFSIPQLVAHLSRILPLLPGDLIFTGTPSGIGWVRDPRRTIAPGEELVTFVEGIGEMRHTFVAR
ncbi:2-keto-4-pentenoate hydratase/2-oxohepta-3-ene-1,7-dioic acid hydratase (catechol pathway) [Geodermatophilus africanus]|uniref:2-keto-4-pentenoate hydratase/2-oxohepta-3-ene-1,7-dioic acid hydratase (Catechol pathway) n=1 Tax=Geodermatophilus africanus TaxID=1137993 RepID=A0A1H3QJH1_9ACTN|nr:fumarylacetoacetate hydrolase family protein [Geodermatophilus africanus]SDZ13566.1 2-keto-4-pentenoate hydratase/2-oxohepta-3-ene-1,7-dioic acid hydratase (catechol pathway) [Geodermatophilus africanus]